MKLSITVPGKTFVIGEYLVLSQGEALVWTSQPCFELVAERLPSSSGELNPFHPQSPAGKLWESFPEFKKIKLQFKDTYGKGGFGGSTAEYLSLLALRDHLQGSALVTGRTLIEEYLQHAFSGEGRAPSGVDLWAQQSGGLALYNKKTNQRQAFLWPFSDVAVYFVHTGYKVPTHQHLKENLTIPEAQLASALQHSVKALTEKNLELWLQSLKNYADALCEAGLTCENSVQLRKKLESLSGVYLAKPCGALGADVLCVFVDQKQESSLLAAVKCDTNLTAYKASGPQAQGVQIKILQ